MIYEARMQREGLGGGRGEECMDMCVWVLQRVHQAFGHFAQRARQEQWQSAHSSRHACRSLTASALSLLHGNLHRTPRPCLTPAQRSRRAGEKTMMMTRRVMSLKNLKKS